MRCRFALLGLGACLLATSAGAERTKLLEVDLQTGARRQIDEVGPRTSAERELDAALESATGERSFSTRQLAQIEQALRRYLQMIRPRAIPRLLLFLYPGRISRSGLEELREVLVDIDLLVEPCARTVCRDAVAKDLELLGRSIGQTLLRTGRYTIRFQTVTIRARLDAPGGETYETFRFNAAQVVASGTRAGGGAQLVSQLDQAQKGYAQEMSKQIAKQLQQRRIKLAQPPRVDREQQSIAVSLEVRSDRNRYRTHVLEAFAGTTQALAASPLTPTRARLSLVAQIPFHGIERKQFTCESQPLSLYLAGRLSAAEVWSDYIIERRREGTQLDFSDEEASGRGGEQPEEGGDDRTQEILAAHFNVLAPCLQTEASHNPRLQGVTLRFAVAGNGEAVGLSIKEKTSAALARCLAGALRQIHFQRHGGAPRGVEYPMYIQR